jgi:hypothetical protein
MVSLVQLTHCTTGFRVHIGPPRNLYFCYSPTGKSGKLSSLIDLSLWGWVNGTDTYEMCVWL